MNFKQLVRETWKDERVRDLSIKMSEVNVVLTVLFEKIEESLVGRKAVKIRNFFTLELRTIKGRKSKIGNKEVEYDDYEKVIVKASKRLKDNINQK